MAFYSWLLAERTRRWQQNVESMGRDVDTEKVKGILAEQARERDRVRPYVQLEEKSWLSRLGRRLRGK